MIMNDSHSIIREEYLKPFKKWLYMNKIVRRPHCKILFIEEKQNLENVILLRDRRHAL